MSKKSSEVHWSLLGSLLNIEKRQLNNDILGLFTATLERVRQQRLLSSPVGNTGSGDSPRRVSPIAHSSNIVTPKDSALLMRLRESLNVERNQVGGRVPRENDFKAVEFLHECLSEKRA